MKSSTKDPDTGGLCFAHYGMRIIRNLLPLAIGHLHISVVERNYEPWHNQPLSESR
jgi:hypothetical protein